jgi:TRAP-type C4-dicarboxylate transport system permease small subunit
MSILARIGKVFDHLNTAMVVVCAILVVGLTFIVGADITLRYLFNKPLGWVKEVSEYSLVGLGFLAAAWILKDDAHVKMDLILTKVGPRTQTMMNLITSAISTIVVIIITWFSIRVTLDFYQTKIVTPSVLEPPKWILMTPVIIGSFLLAMQFVRRTYAYVDKWKRLSGQQNHR